MLKCLAAWTALLVLGGCAGTLSTIMNDPLHHYEIGKQGTSVYAMTGDRRTAVMFEPDSKYRFCAESLPDAVTVFTASSGAKANLPGKGEVELHDQSAAAVLQTFHRTEMAEVYRQMGWNACIAWAQYGITDIQYYTLLNLMTTEGMKAINTRAGQEPKIVESSTGAIILSTPEKSTIVRPSATPTSSPSPPPTP